MPDKDKIKQIKEQRIKWEKNCHSKTIEKNHELKQKFKNLSEIEIKNIFTPEDIASIDYVKDIYLVIEGIRVE